MSHGVDRKRRRTVADGSVEALEGRVLLSQASRPTIGAPAAEVASMQQRGTVMSLQASTETRGARPSVTLTATVRTAGSLRVIHNGRVKFSILSPTAEPLGTAFLDRLGQATVKTSRLGSGGTYEVQAQYVSPHGPFAPTTAELDVTVAPPVVTSFLIRAPQYFGSPGTPITFSVSALDRAHQVVTDYAGTIGLSSKTDHTATLQPGTYTFTTTDQGTHEFPDGVTFHKGGAEVVKVVQLNNTRIVGTQAFGIQ